ncbi:MAG: hypothetical protein ACO1TE_05050 [Prosthecobacter sp.]
MDSVINKLMTLEAELPERIRQHVLETMPASTVDDAGCRIIGARDFVPENYHASPSMFIRQFGHWTVARFDNGNAVCLDAESGVVRVFDVGAFIGRKSNEGFVMIKSPDADGRLRKTACSAENILPFVIEYFDSWTSFVHSLKA